MVMKTNIHSINPINPLKKPIRKPTKLTGLKLLKSKQMLQRLLIALVKAGNTSEHLLNEIHQIIYF